MRRASLDLWLALAAALLLALPILTYPPGRDQGEFATLGRGILQGRVPYIEMWNPKPPAVFYTYALALRLFGETPAAIRALDYAIAAVTIAALLVVGRRLIADGLRLGLWAALLFCVFYFTETFWTLSQNDGLAMALMAAALALVMPVPGAPYRTPALHIFAAGLLFGLIIGFKYNFALLLLPLAGAVWLGRPAPRALLAAALAFGAGAALALGGGVLLLIRQGAWGEFLLSAQVTAQYTALTFNLTDFGDLLWTALGYRWQHWGLLALLAALWLLPPVRRRIGGARGGWWVVMLWLAAALAMMLVQAKAYDYHWLPMLPPLALLAAGVVEGRASRGEGQTVGTGLALSVSGVTPGRLRHRGMIVQDPTTSPSTQHPKRTPRWASLLSTLFALALLLILAAGVWPVSWRYLTGQEDQTAYYDRFVAGEVVAGESLRVAQLLRERVAPGDSLTIWGFRPEVYFLSRLNPGSRFIFQFPLVGAWYPAAWRQEHVDTLWASMPPYALVLQVDYMPWVTGSHEDSNTLLQAYTEMNNWLLANYDFDSQIGNFFLWRRKA